MVWEPFALALLFGLLISGGIYFIFVWPRIEPPDGTGDVDDLGAGVDEEE